MAARRHHRGPAPVVDVPRRAPRVISIRELRWNARLAIVSQLAYIVGKLPRQVRLVAGIAVLGALWALVTVVVAYWPYLLTVALAWLLWRAGRPRWAAWRARRAGESDIPY